MLGPPPPARPGTPPTGGGDYLNGDRRAPQLGLQNLADSWRRVPVPLEDLAVRSTDDLRLALGHVGSVDLPENRLEVDPVRLGGAVDDVEQVGQGVRHSHQVSRLARVPELGELLFDQEHAKTVQGLTGPGGTIAVWKPEVLVEVAHHQLLVVHFSSWEYEPSPRGACRTQAPKPVGRACPPR